MLGWWITMAVSSTMILVQYVLVEGKQSVSLNPIPWHSLFGHSISHYPSYKGGGNLSREQPFSLVIRWSMI